MRGTKITDNYENAAFFGGTQKLLPKPSQKHRALLRAAYKCDGPGLWSNPVNSSFTSECKEFLRVVECPDSQRSKVDPRSSRVMGARRAQCQANPAFGQMAVLSNANEVASGDQLTVVRPMGLRR
jgi:hypothetical protein